MLEVALRAFKTASASVVQADGRGGSRGLMSRRAVGRSSAWTAASRPLRLGLEGGRGRQATFAAGWLANWA